MFFTKVAQIFGKFWSHFENKSWYGFLCETFWKKICFLLHYLVTYFYVIYIPWGTDQHSGKLSLSQQTIMPIQDF